VTLLVKIAPNMLTHTGTDPLASHAVKEGADNPTCTSASGHKNPNSKKVRCNREMQLQLLLMLIPYTVIITTHHQVPLPSFPSMGTNDKGITGAVYNFTQYPLHEVLDNDSLKQ